MQRVARPWAAARQAVSQLRVARPWAAARQAAMQRVARPWAAARQAVSQLRVALPRVVPQPAVLRPAGPPAPAPSPGLVTFMQLPAQQHRASLPIVLLGFFIARTPGPFTRSGKGALSSGTGGTLQDIGVVAGTGFADGGAQDTFCGTASTTACSISLLYDQSGKGNNLKVAPAGCYTGGNAPYPDYESGAGKKSVTISGHKVYALYMIPQDGYRNDSPSGMPTGSTTGQGIYEIADGTRTGNTAGSACCWDFGNALTNNCNGGTMNALLLRNWLLGYWCRQRPMVHGRLRGRCLGRRHGSIDCK